MTNTPIHQFQMNSQMSHQGQPQLNQAQQQMVPPQVVVPISPQKTQHQTHPIVNGHNIPIGAQVPNPVNNQAYSNPAGQMPVNTQPINPVDQQFNALFGEYFRQINPVPATSGVINRTTPVMVDAYGNQHTGHQPNNLAQPNIHSAQVPSGQHANQLAVNPLAHPVAQVPLSYTQTPANAQMSVTTNAPLDAAYANTSINQPATNLHMINGIPAQSQPVAPQAANQLQPDVTMIDQNYPNNQAAFTANAQQSNFIPPQQPSNDDALKQVIAKQNSITCEKMQDVILKSGNIPAASVPLIKDYLSRSLSPDGSQLVSEQDVATTYNNTLYQLRGIAPNLFEQVPTQNNMFSIPSPTAAGNNGYNPNDPALMMNNHLEQQLNGESFDFESYRNMFHATLG